MTELEKKLQELAQARDNAESQKDYAKNLLETLKEENGYNELCEQLKKSEALRDALDTEVRALATQYEQDGLELPPEVKVNKGKQVVVHDHNAAVRWSIDNFTPALMLNDKVFDKMVLAMAPDGGVPEHIAEVLGVPKVKIASDLSRLLDTK